MAVDLVSKLIQFIPIIPVTQQYTSHSIVIVKRVFRDLEEEIRGLEISLLNHSSTDSGRLQQKKQEFLRKEFRGQLWTSSGQGYTG